ncbi:uncharacterized protein LOC121835528 [Ixodes scapularis]|uniref:uncharacterized protein LOC121835528 n=1 Tax=Ixodes scapularis TaxID=6945 RepID=UPI001C3843DE|nr:uncharacterized protein LOC121835528 [Ixodes scapularis]
MKCGRRDNHDHNPKKAPFMSSVCFKCEKTGHLAKVCMSRSQASGWAHQDQGHVVAAARLAPGEELDLRAINSVSELPVHKPWNIPLSGNGVLVTIKVNTGAPVWIISVSVPTKSSVMAKTGLSSDEAIMLPGSPTSKRVTYMRLEHKRQSAKASVYVLDYNGPSLCGHEVTGALRVIQTINFAEVEDRVFELKTKFRELFKPGIGQMEEPSVHLHLD